MEKGILNNEGAEYSYNTCPAFSASPTLLDPTQVESFN